MEKGLLDLDQWEKNKQTNPWENKQTNKQTIYTLNMHLELKSVLLRKTNKQTIDT